MVKKITKAVFVLLIIIVGLYPLIYFFVQREFGLLGSKPAALLKNLAWNIAFYTHIILGGIALLTGWVQFSKKLRARYLKLHKGIGKLYVISVLLSAIAGFYIAFFATGGLITAMGFICLALIWFCTTLLAYIHIRNKRVLKHQQMMIYSYAACFGAVTLRIWLPLLTIAFGNFIIAYTITAWLSWVPNMVVAHYYIKRALPFSLGA